MQACRGQLGRRDMKAQPPPHASRTPQARPRAAKSFPSSHRAVGIAESRSVRLRLHNSGERAGLQGTHAERWALSLSWTRDSGAKPWGSPANAPLPGLRHILRPPRKQAVNKQEAESGASPCPQDGPPGRWRSDSLAAVLPAGSRGSSESGCHRTLRCLLGCADGVEQTSPHSALCDSGCISPKLQTRNLRLETWWLSRWSPLDPATDSPSSSPLRRAAHSCRVPRGDSSVIPAAHPSPGEQKATEGSATGDSAHGPNPAGNSPSPRIPTEPLH